MASTSWLNAETLMLGYGYDPSPSEGSAKPPVFLTSTFVFQTAEQGRDFFGYLAGRRAPPVGGQTGLVYSRFNHPNLEIGGQTSRGEQNVQRNGALLEHVTAAGPHIGGRDVELYGRSRQPLEIDEVSQNLATDFCPLDLISKARPAAT